VSIRGQNPGHELRELGFHFCFEVSFHFEHIAEFREGPAAEFGGVLTPGIQ